MKRIDRLLSKWTILSFFAIFELGSVLCGAATSSKMLIVGRGIAGLGASGLLNGGYTIIHAMVPLHKQPCMNPDLPRRVIANNAS